MVTARLDLDIEGMKCAVQRAIALHADELKALAEKSVKEISVEDMNAWMQAAARRAVQAEVHRAVDEAVAAQVRTAAFQEKVRELAVEVLRR